MKSKKARSEKLLTQVELEIMGPLWRLGEATVHQVSESLPKERKLAYTSISTMLRILEQKGFVSSRKEGRGHVYIPAVAKENYETVALENVVARVFDGTPASLVRRLLATSDLSEDDLKSIQSLLQEKLT
jgi:predicted transcriptional regulator